jgi:mannosyltransferase
MEHARPIHAQPFRLLTLLAFWVAFAVRLWGLGAQSLWYDETVSAFLARASLPDLLAHTARDIHPPGYYLLLHGWQGLTHPTPAHGLEFLFAYPSLWFGLLILTLTFVLGRRLFSPTVALVALWLAAIHPFQIWYSQEVRMYTIGACWGLLALWALLQLHAARRTLPWAFVAMTASAAGLYTLYYFLFVVATLNLIALQCFWPLLRTRVGRRRVAGWVLAQIGAGLLWAPWLPIFWRQILEPPVPPWRLPWSSLAAVGQSLSEALAALLVGQSPPGGITWPWALIALGLVLWSGWRSGWLGQGQALGLTLQFIFVPIGLIFALSLAGVPLYHVRYLFTYAAPFVLVMAVACASFSRRTLFIASILLLVLICGWSLQRYWVDPRYRRDDHRGAVALLAEQWRPGDAILVNAGWVYTALALYWPVELPNPFAATPPPIDAYLRLTDTKAATALQAPSILRSGSVDGAPGLGWGDPQSDFYAISTAATETALAAVAAHAPRLWHYRLYDTVSDSAGVIRTWLATNGEQRVDHPFPGRDFLRLQMYEFPKAVATSPASAMPVATFGSAVELEQVTFAPQVAAGTRLYVQTGWRALPGLAQQPGDLAWSLRLYAANGALLAQADSGAWLPTTQWQPGKLYALPLALSLPAAAKPDTYTLQLVVYDRTTGQPLPLAASPEPASTLPLGEVTVLPASQPVGVGEVQATFDYIDLVAVQPVTQTVISSEPLPLNLLWRPRPNDYQETYAVRLTLQGADGTSVTTWEETLGGWAYPSGAWPPGVPVLDQKRLPIDAALAPGSYALTLQVIRAADGQVIPARRGWFASASQPLVVGAVTVIAP